jgi:hypothetical protein
MREGAPYSPDLSPALLLEGAGPKACFPVVTNNRGAVQIGNHVRVFSIIRPLPT